MLRFAVGGSCWHGFLNVWVLDGSKEFCLASQPWYILGCVLVLGGLVAHYDVTRLIVFVGSVRSSTWCTKSGLHECEREHAYWLRRKAYGRGSGLGMWKFWRSAVKVLKKYMGFTPCQAFDRLRLWPPGISPVVERSISQRLHTRSYLWCSICLPLLYFTAWYLTRKVNT